MPVDIRVQHVYVRVQPAVMTFKGCDFTDYSYSSDVADREWVVHSQKALSAASRDNRRIANMGHSKRCQDLTTYMYEQRCVPCTRPAKGEGITPNCGFDDDGGRHEMPSQTCPDNTFNDGRFYFCQNCSLCKQGFITVDPCNTTADTKCQTIIKQSIPEVPVKANSGVTELSSATWAVPVALIVCSMLLIISYWAICSKRKRGYRSHMRQFTPLPATQETNELNHILSSEILAAPLKSVLDNLDVLEELVILLDPETQGLKNTKHLASLCNFSANWVNYTYSLKDCKSPLKALLEGVTSRHPEWTVGHFTELLRQIERMDAIVVLSKLRLDIINV